MAERNLAQEVTAAARTVARIEVKRRKFRKHLEQLDAEYRDAQRALRLLVSAVEPFEPPVPADAARANDAIDGRL